MRGNGQLLNQLFFFHYLQLDNVVDWIEKNAIGATMLNLSTSIFNIKIGKTPPRGETHWFNTNDSLKWASIKDMRNSDLYIFNTSETIDKKAIKRFNFDSMGSTSSIGTAINLKIVKRIPFIIPKRSAMNSFNSLLKPYFQNIKNLQTQNQHLKEARDILLPRLMTGMIDVEKLELEL
ncbi:MAG: hypothetical protein B6D64_07425 [Bacteroidetes bacterium 4484_276]|nr:MAG: hypothetical protein B6D64_07425 [Bacteroidetes bacterium 4484_276]